MNGSYYIAGHTGLVGSSLLRSLNATGSRIITKSPAELDLTQQSEVNHFFKNNRPDFVVLAAARVGGINANQKYPVEFLYENLMITANVLHSAAEFGVKKLIYLSSACVYPRLAEQPIQEKSLLTGPLEPTNEAYALAKISGIKLCEAYQRQYSKNFISIIPANLYGPGDHFDLERAHVIPGMIKRFHYAKINQSPNVQIWGTGRAIRDFLFVDDLAQAVFFLMEKYNEIAPLNVGTGQGTSIAELATTLGRIVGYKGKIEFDASKPDGMPKKVLECTRLNELGWKPQHSLESGLQKTYEWCFDKNIL